MNAAEHDALVECLPLALLVANMDGRIQWANPAAAELTGHEVPTLLTMSVEDLIPEPLRQHHHHMRRQYSQAPVTRMMGGGKTSSFPLQRGDGHIIQIDIQLVPCHHRGQPAIMASLIDLRPVAMMLAQDMHRADMARSTFLANMSHEIRTPLNAIMGMSQLLEIDSPTPRQQDRLRQIENASEHLLAIVNDVLDLAQIETGHFKVAQAPLSIHEVVEQSVALVAHRAALKQLELNAHIDPGVPARVLGDARRIEQVLVNLLGNAVKFTPAGSVDLTVSTQSMGQDGVSLRFEVQDTGIGIAPEHIDTLFRPFSQVAQSAGRRFGGTGLGLAISRELSQAMGGDCGVSSIQGCGSCFWFTVSVAPWREAPSALGHVSLNPPPSTEAVAQALKGRRLLLVEDDRINQILMVDLLEALGAPQVDVAETGGQALEALSDQRYDLVFMDMQLPGLDGPEVTRQARTLPHCANVPIVALTANVLPEDVFRCLDAGMTMHLGKPFGRHELSRVIMRFLGVAPSFVPARVMPATHFTHLHAPATQGWHGGSQARQ